MASACSVVATFAEQAEGGRALNPYQTFNPSPSNSRLKPVSLSLNPRPKFPINLLKGPRGRLSEEPQTSSLNLDPQPKSQSISIPIYLVKGPRDRLSEEQRAWLLALESAFLDVEVFKVVEEEIQVQVLVAPAFSPRFLGT